MHSAAGDRWTVRAASCRRQNGGRYKVKGDTAGDAGSGRADTVLNVILERTEALSTQAALRCRRARPASCRRQKSRGGTKSRSRLPVTLEADGRTAVLNVISRAHRWMRYDCGRAHRWLMHS